MDHTKIHSTLGQCLCIQRIFKWRCKSVVGKMLYWYITVLYLLLNHFLSIVFFISLFNQPIASFISLLSSATIFSLFW